MYLYRIKDLLRIFVHLMLCRLAFAGVRTTACGGNPADVMFVLDSSTSIWKPDFQRQLTFVQEMVDIFPIAPNLTRVALVTYDTRPRVIFYFNTFKSKSRMRRRIGQVRRDPHMHTFTDRALRIMRKIVRTERFGARFGDEEVTQVAIIITDGRSDNTTATGLEAAKAREQGIHIFAIGVGDKVDELELQSIASKPTHQYVHRVHNYESLDTIKELLAIKTCTVTDSATSLPSTIPITTQSTTASTTTTSTATPTTKTKTTTATTTPTTTQTASPTTHSTASTQSPTTSANTNRTSTAPHPTTASSTTPAATTTTRASTPTAETTVRPTQSTSPRFGIDNRGAVKIGVQPTTPSTEAPPRLVPYAETDEFVIKERENEINPVPSATTKVPASSHIRPPFDPEGINNVCVFDEPTDIVFVIDEKKGGPHIMNNIWKFIKDLLSYVDMSNGNVNVKFIYECIDIPDVQLGSYRNKTALLSALNRLARHPRTSADLLQHMSYRLLGSDVNSIEPHHKIGVYITDGPSGNLSATLNEAQTAKLLHNIELFGVGIGKDLDPTELRALVSCEVDKHLHMVLTPRKLDGVVHPVIKELCKVRRHHSRHVGF